MAASRNRGCVAAGHPITAEAGDGILRAGGNAVDAAVAAACMSFLAEPVLTGAGGGGFMLLCRPDGASLLLDGFARMPAGLGESTPPEDFKAIPVDFGDTVQTFHIGRGSVATPGLMSMLFSAQQRYGRIPMREVLAPAMHAARHGVTLNALQASFIHLLDPILSSTGPCKAMHSSKDGLLKAGESFSNPDLANLLELLCMEGVDEMYLGDVARSIVSACQPGGLLGIGDLAACRVIERRPLNIKALNGVLLSNPPPLFRRPAHRILPVTAGGNAQAGSWHGCQPAYRMPARILSCAQCGLRCHGASPRLRSRFSAQGQDRQTRCWPCRTYQQGGRPQLERIRQQTWQHNTYQRAG